MPRLNRVGARKDIERVVLTDLLPYEVPLYFNNIKLYKALGSNSGHKLVRKILDFSGETIPCKFHIAKRPAGTREMSIIHPAVQRQFANFYDQYDGHIGQLSARSKYSLRYPVRPASRYFDSRYVDQESPESVDLDHVGYTPQSDFSSSYFAYRKYSHVYKFYESPEFLRLERSHRFLLRIDVSKCFASLYTHSLAWAVRGKDLAKDAKSRRGVDYFESRFDELMRNSNWGETHGIPVGPEVSRIFCEIILQKVDVEVEREVGNDVTIRRYMDDYFIFAQSEAAASSAENIIAEQLSYFGLYLNENKRHVQRSPLISGLTVARREVIALIDSFMSEVVRSIDESTSRDGVALGKGTPGHADSTARARRGEILVRNIRATARRYNVDYSGLASPALAVIARQLNSKVNRIKRNKTKISGGRVASVQREISSVLQVIEFLYISDIRASTSNKVARVFLELADFSDAMGMGRSLLELHMLDIVKNAIATDGDAKLLDLLNALVAVQLICTDGRGLSEADVSSLLARRTGSDRVEYLNMTAGIFLSGDTAHLRQIRDRLIADALGILRGFSVKSISDTSKVMLLLDVLSCPYIPERVRADLYSDVDLALFSKNRISKGDALGELRKVAKELWFVDWNVSRGSLHALRNILRKSELRLAYD